LKRLRGKTVGWTVYILGCSDDSLYTGITNDLERRIEEHESGTGAKYTKGRGPFKVLYVEEQPSRGHALKRELEIKALDRAGKFELMDNL
jgi:putative endonuclease